MPLANGPRQPEDAQAKGAAGSCSVTTVHTPQLLQESPRNACFRLDSLSIPPDRKQLHDRYGSPGIAKTGSIVPRLPISVTARTLRAPGRVTDGLRPERTCTLGNRNEAARP